MEVPAVKTQHLAYQRKLLLPEFPSFDYWKKSGDTIEKPETIIPYPVTFWELPLKRHEESKLVADEVDDSFMVWSGTDIRTLRTCKLKLVP